MKITNIRFLRVKGTWTYDGPLGEERLVRPTDIYPEFRAQRPALPVSHPAEGPPYPLEAIFLFIDTDKDVSGMYGTISMEDARIIASQFARILIGENPHSVERIWDKMYRHAIHGRKGPTMMAISKVDLALWDLKGKLLNAPVYELLGGPSRDKIRAYASMLGYSIEPELVAQRAGEVVAQGYTATKWFFRHDPTEGAEGIRRNLELIRAVREAVGPDVEIMFDAWSSWDVPYTRRMAELAAEYHPWWFEEPVMADMIPQYAELRRTVSTVTWAGGLTEMTKICALASSCGIPVIPHHGGMASTQLIASQTITTCPIQEWLLQHGLRGNFFLKHKIEPVDGHIQLPEGPGLSMELDEDAIESREEVTFS